MACQANIGIVYFPDHGGDVDTLVQRAGIALYVAQNSNKGYALYDPSYDEHTPRQLTLMSELNQAVERGELELYYQPKLDLRNDCVSSAEALVRWNHKARLIVAGSLCTADGTDPNDPGPDPLGHRSQHAAGCEVG
nr:EAL domain-containing protein [Aliamphritea spongicola]